MNTQSERIRITQPGYANYTGLFGHVEFVDALSVYPVDHMTAARLGAIILIEKVDSGTQAGAAASLQEHLEDRCPVVEELAKVEQDIPVAEVKSTLSARSRDELEAIADAEGINGLRKIAEPLSIKARGIGELIDAILRYQEQK